MMKTGSRFAAAGASSRRCIQYRVQTKCSFFREERKRHTAVAVVVAVRIRVEVGVTVRSGSITRTTGLRIIRLVMMMMMMMVTVVISTASAATNRRHVASRHRSRLHTKQHKLEIMLTTINKPIWLEYISTSNFIRRVVHMSLFNYVYRSSQMYQKKCTALSWSSQIRNFHNYR